jgi:hypothetical protein
MTPAIKKEIAAQKAKEAAEIASHKDDRRLRR